MLGKEDADPRAAQKDVIGPDQVAGVIDGRDHARLPGDSSPQLPLLIVQLVFGFRSVHPENVPADGPVIVAGNHVSYLDPVILGIGFRRPVTYLAKKELFVIPVLGPIITWLGVLPLDREAGGVAAVRGALRALKDGRCVGIRLK